MEMAGYSPPTGQQQQRLLFLAFRRTVSSMNETGPSSPNRAFSVSIPNPLPLPVGVIINEDAETAKEEYQRRQWGAQISRVVDEVERMARIQAG